MKISYNWLKRYTDIGRSPEELSELLTDCGLEVEGLERFQSVKGGLKGVVIGEVMSCEKHPNADKLSLTTVNVGGDRPLAVICGAPNVEAGQKVLVATVGTTLYDGDEHFEIKKTRIRGEESEGMICAEDELGLGSSHEGIMVLDQDATVGMQACEYFDVEEDYVFEIGLTPNRTDATSHIGVARDIVAVLNASGNQKRKLNIPSVDEFIIDDTSQNIEIEIEDPHDCPRFSGISITGVRVAESPMWLKNSLNAIGIRPINNIVDITNYVLMETGQPLHAYDINEIKGGKVVIRKARKGEKFVTLDEIQRELSEDDLMICDVKSGLCIAGVFGGAKSGVTENTRDIFLESANFNPVSVRKTSRLHGLQTDASFRFERGADPNITVYALKRAAGLIRELAGGRMASEIKDAYPVFIDNKHIEIKLQNVDRLVGKTIERPLIRSILEDLGIQVLEEDQNGLKLSIPTYKVDVTREADVIEEILRIYGYNNVEIPDVVRSSLSFVVKPDREKLRDIIADLLTGSGFSEIINNSLTRSAYVAKSNDYADENNVNILNPLSSDLNVLRQSMLFGGLETIAFNQNRKINDLKIYEFGRIYKYLPEKSDARLPLKKYFESEYLTIFISGNMYPEDWRNQDRKMDLYDLKAYVRNILIRLGIYNDSLSFTNYSSDQVSEGFSVNIKDRTLVHGGKVSSKWTKDFSLKQEVFYAGLNWEFAMALVKDSQITFQGILKYPEVRRDLALLIDSKITFEQLRNLAFQTERKLLKSVNLFDIYEGDKIGPGKKSYALSFILQDEHKTLTDKIIDKTMNRLIKAFEEAFQAIIR